ncbi:MAG: GntR family transcriptional regulator [Herminiimonas sp.]|nr:GntR family transcriptional regulator [Herminiimonas sp.]
MPASMRIVALRQTEEDSASSRADRIYQALKKEIFSFRLLPGDVFSEREVAARHAVSRTPVREALVRLKREAYLEVHVRAGWSVKPFDFRHFENLYDLRLVLELAAVTTLCETRDIAIPEALTALWLVPKEKRVRDQLFVSTCDEDFHCTLVRSAGNPAMARVHGEAMEHLRTIRRLDYTQPSSIDCTYDDHRQILQAILDRRADRAVALLREHVETHRADIKGITQHWLRNAQERRKQ